MGNLNFKVAVTCAELADFNLNRLHFSDFDTYFFFKRSDLLGEESYLSTIALILKYLLVTLAFKLLDPQPLVSDLIREAPVLLLEVETLILELLDLVTERFCVLAHLDLNNLDSLRKSDNLLLCFCVLRLEFQEATLEL